MSLLTIKNLSIGYEPNIVIKDLNFSINEGDYVCIVGENGSGKTTLMKTLLGLLEPISGEIIFGDGLKKNELGYLPQQNNIQKDFPASVYEIVISGFLNQQGFRPFYNSKEKEIAFENLKKLGIYELKDKCYKELSGGQQQRVLLVRSLCATKKIIFLDEPIAGLDPNTTKEFYEIIKKLNHEGTTIIMISHDIKMVANEANHILYIGDNIFYGTKEEYFNNNIEKVFLKQKGGKKDDK